MDLPNWIAAPLAIGLFVAFVWLMKYKDKNGKWPWTKETVKAKKK